MTQTIKNYVLLSKKGMKELRKRLSQLEHEQKAAIQALREMDKGTAHEERLEHVERLAHLESIESELTDKRLLLASAKLLPGKRARLKVAIGSVVDLIDQQGRLFRYTIVDSFEANPSDGRISIESPLGRSLLGKTLQDTVNLVTGKQHRSLQLVKIR